jgi:DNA-directed RNA polymerase subunit K/omega
MAFLEEPDVIDQSDRSDASDPAHECLPTGEQAMTVLRPARFNAYEFVVIAALRAKQLLAGCTPRLDGDHSAATMAQMEVAAGRVARTSDASVPKQCLWQR